MMGAVTFAVSLCLAGADADAGLADAWLHAQAHEVDAAITDYEKLLSQGRDGAGLRYNLGTLYLQNGDVGAALFHLRVAQRLAPNDDDVAHNLLVAREQRVDRVGDDDRGDVGDRLAPAGTRWGAGIALVFLGVLSVLHALLRRRATWALTCVAATCAAMGCGALWLRVRAEGVREGVVIVRESVTRQDASAAADEGFAAHAGLSGRVVDEAGDYVQLRLENGVESWFERRALRIYPESVPTAH